MARPLKDIKDDEVRMLAERMWKNTEIAAFFGVDEGTIRKRFSETLAKGREVAKGKLRDLQWKAAGRLNPTMLIWLGKQYLDQTDHKDVEILDAGEHFKTIADAITQSDTGTNRLLSGSTPIRN